MTITPEVIDFIKVKLQAPEQPGQRPIKECFAASATVTAKHILANDFITNEYPSLPKLILYIVMEKLYGPATGKDQSGCAGYHMKYQAA